MHILPVNPLVIDTVHQVANEEDTQAAYGTLINSEGGVGLAYASGVKLRTRIAENESYPALISLNSYAYFALSIILIGIIDDIGNSFFNSQLDLVGKPGFHVQGRRGRLNKRIEFRDFAHLIN